MPSHLELQPEQAMVYLRSPGPGIMTYKGVGVEVDYPAYRAFLVQEQKARDEGGYEAFGHRNAPGYQFYGIVARSQYQWELAHMAKVNYWRVEVVR